MGTIAAQAEAHRSHKSVWTVFGRVRQRAPNQHPNVDPGEKRCSQGGNGLEREQCSGGDWVSLSACDPSTPICSDGECFSGPDSPNKVACGQDSTGSYLTCGVGEQCCYTDTASTANARPPVATGDVCATSGSEFEFDCDGPSDCGSGAVCCRVAYMRLYSYCTVTCTGNGAAVMCNIADGGANNPACASGQTCTETGNLGHATCK